MGRGKKLDITEINLIQKHKNLKKSNRQIAALLGRSVNVINNYIKNQATYGTKKSPGRPRKIKPRTEKMFLRTQSSAPKNAKTLLAMTETECNVRTVQRVLSGPLKMKYRKMQGTPELNTEHKNNRYQFARNFSAMGENGIQLSFQMKRSLTWMAPTV